jgi:hypothetical protein
MPKVAALKEQQDEKFLTNIYKLDKFKLITKLITVVVFLLLAGLAAYIFLESSVFKHPVAFPS